MLLRAALALLLEHGASALTMSAIATAADISRPTLYRYYPDIDALLHVVTHASGHDNPGVAALLPTLPPTARDVLTRHEQRTTSLLTEILRNGITQGVFRSDLEPASDAPLILGLATVANPNDPERALTLIRRITDQQEKPT